MNAAVWLRCLAAVVCGLPVLAGATTLFAIGDTGDCSTSGAQAVSAAIRAQADWRQGWLIEAGDLAYPSATPKNLARCHEPYFAMFGKRLAVPGNHDEDRYGTARGFRGLFPQALPRAVELGGRWRVLLLDSERRGEAWQAQLRWLDRQLDHVAGTCVIAAWHRPRWSSGWHGDDADMAPLWERLAGVATFTLHGHDHHYEAVGPLDKAGDPDANGTRSFVVGNGGASLYPPVRKSPNSKTIAGRWGFLRIDIEGERYRWTEFDVSGDALDSGSGECRLK